MICLDGGRAMNFDLETTFPTLKNPPVTEATIDLRVIRSLNFTMDDLASFRAGFESEFQEKSERRSLQVSIEIEQGEARVVTPGREAGRQCLSGQERAPDSGSEVLTDSPGVDLFGFVPTGPKIAMPLPRAIGFFSASCDSRSIRSGRDHQ
jgi:hypothetical protein